MSYQAKDITGSVFGRLTIVRRAPRLNQETRARWLCRCACGNTTEVFGKHLRSGSIRSCGCLQREMAKSANTKHGREGTRLYRIWENMKKRCTNENTPGYGNYGGRGITYDLAWEEFTPFMKWAEENGYQENLELDREDNNKGYTPENSRWVTRLVNQRNKRTNHRLTAFGETKILAEWAEDERCAVSAPTLHARIKVLGWTAERAILTKSRRL